MGAVVFRLFSGGFGEDGVLPVLAIKVLPGSLDRTVFGGRAQVDGNHQRASKDGRSRWDHRLACPMLEIERKPVDKFPEWIDQETWQAFEEARRRYPLTDFARKRILAKLENFHRQGYVANEILATAAEMGWRSVFLTSDTPRRESTPAEKHTQATVMQMVSGIGRK